MRFRVIGVAAVLILISCAGADQSEAARFTKSLESRRTVFRTIDASYAELISGVDGWARRIMRSGGGGRAEVAKLQTLVDSLRAKLVALDAYLGGLPLREPETQLQRSRLTHPLHDDIVALDPLIAGLSAAFTAYNDGPDHDHYPHAVREVAMAAESVRLQPIAVDDVIESLRRQYSLTDEQIANATEFGIIPPTASPRR